MFDVHEITALHRDTVDRWHRQDIDNPYSGLLALVCEQHQFNFQLWHEEDVARSPNVGDARIAAVKRSIDKYNQQRNNAIEKIDDFLVEQLAELKVQPQAAARLNTETPGSAIDRLSILALRIYHMQEQAERADASTAHRASAAAKLAILGEQHADLSQSLGELAADIAGGRKQLKVYRQFKMYNDPALNPHLYGAAKASTS